MASLDRPLRLLPHPWGAPRLPQGALEAWLSRGGRVVERRRAPEQVRPSLPPRRGGGAGRHLPADGAARPPRRRARGRLRRVGLQRGHGRGPFGLGVTTARSGMHNQRLWESDHSAEMRPSPRECGWSTPKNRAFPECGHPHSHKPCLWLRAPAARRNAVPRQGRGSGHRRAAARSGSLAGSGEFPVS